MRWYGVTRDGKVPTEKEKKSWLRGAQDQIWTLDMCCDDALALPLPTRVQYLRLTDVDKTSKKRRYPPISSQLWKGTADAMVPAAIWNDRYQVSTDQCRYLTHPTLHRPSIPTPPSHLINPRSGNQASQPGSLKPEGRTCKPAGMFTQFFFFFHFCASDVGGN